MMKLFSGLLVLTIFLSCDSADNDSVKNEGDVEILLENSLETDKAGKSEIITGNEVYILYSKDKSDSSELTLDYQYYSIEQDTDNVFQDSVNQVIADFIDAVSNMSEERVRKSFSTEMFKESLPLFASFYNELIKDEVTESMFPWDLQSSVSINDYFPEYVKLTTSAWSYTGGAHGNGFTVYTLISKKDGHDMRLSEFFKDVKDLNILAAGILKNDRKLSQVEPLSNAGFWIEDETSFLNDNFYFENGDLIVLFNQYEIASYADGPIEIRIPKSDLIRFLK